MKAEYSQCYLKNSPGLITKTRLSALPPLSPKLPPMSSLTFLLHFEDFDLLTKILKGDFFFISFFTSSFRRQGDEEAIPSGNHVANG